MIVINSTVIPGTALTASQAMYVSRPSRIHPAGVNVTMCDGHVRFLSQDINYQIYCLLMTPDGPNCNTPAYVTGPDPAGAGASPLGTFYYPSGTNSYLYQRNTPLDDG